MPMIMDQDLDDLFGESAALSLPPSPPVRGLCQRVDELRVNGCSQKVAWSKNGCIAYIASDGRGVRLANLRCRPTNGVWEQDTHVESLLAGHIQRIYRGRELAHLSWNSSGIELLVADIYGRLSIFSTLVSINRISAAKVWMTEPEDNLNTLVGMMWLNVERVIPLSRPVVKSGDQWVHALTHHKSKNPYNPSGKPAILTITRSGSVRLVYQSQDSQWQDVRQEFYSTSTSLALLTHATLCPDEDDTVLLLVHTSSKQLRLYRININWPQSNGGGQLPSGGSLPSLTVRHFKEINDCCPIAADSDHPSSFLMTPSSDACLSHLELLPRGPDLPGKDPTSPTVVAVFSYLALSNDYQSPELREETFTVVSRWELRNDKSTLHPSFDILASKRSGPSSGTDLKQEAVLKRLDDVHSERVLIHIQQLSLGSILAMAYSDGSVEFRDRVTLECLPDDESEAISSLGQSRFAFSNTQPCLHVALSPNYCAKVSLAAEHEPKLEVMQSVRNSGSYLEDTSFAERAAIAFAMHTSLACMSNNNNDDLLTAIQVFLRQNESAVSQLDRNISSHVEQKFLYELYRALRVNLDQAFDTQPEKLLRHQMIQKCFSIQATLGFKGRDGNRDIPSKLAWTLLNLRMIALMIAFAFSRSNGPSSSESEIGKPEILQSLIGLVEWSMKLMEYIVDQLLELNRQLSDYSQPFDPDFVRNKIRTLNSPALSLILVSCSRTFLKYNCRGLRGISNIATTHLQNPSLSSSATIVRAASRDLLAIVDKSHVSALQFEQILAEVDSGIKKIYKPTSGNGNGEGFSNADRQELECQMLVEGAIPDALMPVVEKLLNISVEKLKDDIDEAELYFADISLIGLGDDQRCKNWHKTHTLDAVRKIVLAKGKTKIRVCTRCGSQMEDLPLVKGVSVWLFNMQRTCFCGGFWVVE